MKYTKLNTIHTLFYIRVWVRAFMGTCLRACMRTLAVYNKPQGTENLEPWIRGLKPEWQNQKANHLQLWSLGVEHPNQITAVVRVFRLIIVEVWGRDPLLSPIRHSHLVLTSVIMTMGELGVFNMMAPQFTIKVTFGGERNFTSCLVWLKTSPTIMS